MMRSLFSGISGLRNHQTRMDVIGNNIANVNTMGFKSSRVSFQEIFNQTLRGPSSPDGESGGIDPMQVGLGMTVASIDMLDTPGNIQSTGMTTDMALQGEGYFVVSDGATNYYTRAGDFKTDGADYLTNSKGFTVMGWTAIDGVFEPKENDTLSALRIQVGTPEGTLIEGSAWADTDREWVFEVSGAILREGLTERDLTIVGLPEGLSATAQKDPNTNRILLSLHGDAETLAYSAATVKVVVKESAVTAMDAVASGAFTFGLDQVANASAIATNPVIVMNADGKTPDASNAAWVFEVTKGELKDNVSMEDVVISGLPAGLNATLAKDGAANRLMLTLTGSADPALAAGETVTVTLKGSAVKEPGAGDSAPMTVEIRPAGSPSFIGGKLIDANVALAGGNTAANANDRWEIEITQGTLNWPLVAANPGDPEPVIVSGLPSGMSAVVSQGSTPNRAIIELVGNADVPINSPIDATVVFTPLAVTEVPATASVSFPVRIMPRVNSEKMTSVMNAYTVDSLGVITGSFSDGVSRPIGQVAVAMFSNPGGLIRQGDGLFGVSNNSGMASCGTAGNGGRALIAPASLEMSNVDLAWEFTNMIITQRGFQANSRVITTSDEMLQELANLKR